MPNDEFRFKKFTVRQDRCAMKVGTDGVALGAWAEVDGAKRILDIGTGTGLLALIAAQRNAFAHIDAVEIDDASAQQASENAVASPWADRVRVHRMDVRRMATSEPYDLVICNPPYYVGYSASPDSRIGLAKHSGELRFHELLDAVSRLLAAAGRFAVIVPLNREVEFLLESERAGLYPERRCMLSYVAHRPAKRVMLELARSKRDVKESTITVEASGPFDYTVEYRTLIRDLMLNF